jgi:hypothetical protein
MEREVFHLKFLVRRCHVGINFSAFPPFGTNFINFRSSAYKTASELKLENALFGVGEPVLPSHAATSQRGPTQNSKITFIECRENSTKPLSFSYYVLV